MPRPIWRFRISPAYLWDFHRRPAAAEPVRSMKDSSGRNAACREDVEGSARSAASTSVGPTIVYAFMQACGLVNDHLVDCHRHEAVKTLARCRWLRHPRAWQRMLSGRRLDLLDPSPLDIEIEDIAHGLARVARWNGQTKGDHAFSVAQHCVLVEADRAPSRTAVSTGTRG